ncbi:GNAT family N-acetyltransferase [Alteromonas sp. ASW11-19]|uniref:GNAT family N-acetyltransferase n=1 Tax=Alteromonas salexigens TaxID=2982530 RepID=A0ABT2VQD8_9ALTE|nr:GNAT family N-acetyltransferase [Alteromonas salexigens]MCU7555092.1 GNAT family N-acetyltransferase [Alteromonas salexigens]
MSCWLGEAPPASTTYAVPLSQHKKLLGSEYNIAVFDATGPFRPSALLALAGTIKRSGRLLILAPPLDAWPTDPAVLDTHFLSHGWTLTNSKYLQYVIAQAQQDPDLGIYSHKLTLPGSLEAPALISADPPFATSDQARAYAQFFADKEGAHSAIITAPRGRGKSALLGQLAARLMAEGASVLLTSAAKEAVTPVFRHLARAKNVHLTAPLICRHEETGACLRWVAPDNPELLTRNPNWVFVDEAAALPLPQLRAITEHATRCVLTTTLDGYEGSGQGFVQRFVPAFLSDRADARHYTLTQPVRWADNDPVERFLNCTLLFDQHSPAPTCPADELTYRWCRFDQLAPSSLAQVMQLLMVAHYQTTPDDLMRLIDAPDVLVAIVCSADEKHIIGALIINREGGRRLQDLAAHIATGQRRVKGHLGAQRLTLLMADPQLARLRYWRVNRIAVRTEYRQQKVGSKLLAFVSEEARHQHIDAITSSFGFTSPLMAFWASNAFIQVHHGVKTDKASGRQSALVVKPLSATFSSYTEQLQTHCALEAAVLDGRLPLTDEHIETSLASLHLRKLCQLADGTRDSSQCIASLAWLASHPPIHANEDTFPLLAILHHLPLPAAALQQRAGLASKAATKSALQQEVANAIAIIAQQ